MTFGEMRRRGNYTRSPVLKHPNTSKTKARTILSPLTCTAGMWQKVAMN